MTKPMFRRVLDALVDGRMRQAQRFIEQYKREHPSKEPPRQG